MSFDQLVADELAGEDAAIINMAIDKVKEIAAREIAYIEAYR
jgi:hypothetical protein